MEDYGHLTRAEMISLIRELKAGQGSADCPAGEKPAEFQVFSEWQQREFDRSPWPMRIFEHGTFRFLAVNDAAVKLYGYSREEFLKLTARDTRHLDEHAEFLTTLNEPTEYLRHRGARRHIRKDGEIIVVEAVTQDILFNGLKARLSMNIDVTERDRARALLQQREQEFESLAEHLPDLIARFDRNIRHLYVNAATERATGLPRQAFLGRTHHEISLPPDKAGLFDRSMREVFETGRASEIEFSLSTPEGERFFIARQLPEHDADGEVRTALCVAHDVTELRQAVQLLGRREMEFESLAEHLPDLITRFDRVSRFVYVNRAVEKLTGKERSDILGRTQRELGLPEDLVVKFDDSLSGVFNTGDSHTVEFRFPAPDGERLFEALHVAEKDADGKVHTVLCVARDITERKQAELALLRSAALARLHESLARAANEAVTPEAAMTACLELICRHGGWVLGRVALYGESGPQGVPTRSIWHAPDRDGFAEFIRTSEGYVPNVGGSFISRVLQERAAVWVEDMEQVPGFGRRIAAVQHGLHSAFAFPIIVRGEVVAIIEMFSSDARSQDPFTIGAAQSLASQLARIVERERAYQANARMAAIVESSQDAIVSRRLDGTILTWNPGAERLFGYKAAEIVGRSMELLFPPELKKEMVARMVLIEQGLSAPVHETLRIAKDGRRIHVSTSPSVIRDSNGEIWGISTIIRDVTERKLAEQALRASEERFRLLAENIDQVFWINTLAVDNNMYVSPAYEKIWGRSRESLRGDPNGWMTSIHPEDLPRLRGAVDRVAGGDHFDVEYRVIRPDGTLRWIRDRSYPMTRGDGTPLVCGLAEDITDQKQAEQERLTHAVAQRDALVREVHHRIKNSLQGVAGLLRQKISKYPAIAPSIEEAIAQLQSVALIYGLQETRPDGLLNLADITNAICTSAESLLGGRVERAFERKSQRPACVAGSEAVSVAVALNELVFNALKHQAAEAGEKRAHFALRETEDEVEIRITNRGRLPAGFDFSGGNATGHGLGLVRTLLSPGGILTFNGARGEVEVVLKLGPPLLVERQKTAVG